MAADPAQGRMPSRLPSLTAHGCRLIPPSQQNEHHRQEAISQSRDENTLSHDLASELHLLLASPSTQIETTLLIHPHVLGNFLDYNDFLGIVDQLLEALRLCGTIQVASFHPHYRFAGTEPNAAENYTNRSPYPMLHLLRETSISQAADASDELLMIPRRNIETMRNLGQQHILKRLETLDAEQ